MKVLFISNIPSPYRVDFFNELGKLCELTVAFEGKRATDRDEKWKSNCSINYNNVFLRGKRINNDQFFSPSIIKVIKKKKYDYIIIGNYSSPTSMLAIEYMKLHNIKFWIEADGGLVSNERKLKYLLKKYLISSASGWFSSGKMTTEYLIYYGAKQEKIYWYPFTSLYKKEILHYPLSTSEKNKIREQNKGKKIVLAVGQFIYRKGFDILLKAWKQCPITNELYIIGAEPTEEYKKLVKNLQLNNVKFLGFKEKEELKKYYQMADLFVLPTREDIWGLVVNEAMASGLPIITTERCVAGQELVENGVNGYIVPVDNIDVLAEKINLILDDNEKIQEMSKASIKKIQNYTIENMAQIHFELLKSNL